MSLGWKLCFKKLKMYKQTWQEFVNCTGKIIKFSSIKIAEMKNFSRKMKWNRMSTMRMIHCYVICELLHRYYEYDKYVISCKVFITFLILILAGRLYKNIYITNSVRINTLHIFTYYQVHIYICWWKQIVHHYIE